MKALSLLLLVSVPAFAGGQPGGNGKGQAPGHTACEADSAKFCPGIKPGPDGKLRACMTKHQAELSEPCKVWGKKMKAEHDAHAGAAAPAPAAGESKGH